MKQFLKTTFSIHDGFNFAKKKMINRIRKHDSEIKTIMIICLSTVVLMIDWSLNYMDKLTVVDRLNSSKSVPHTYMIISWKYLTVYENVMN